MKKMILKVPFALLLLLIASLALPLASAAVIVDGTSLDPSVVAAGDAVQLSVNFHDDSSDASTRGQEEGYLLEATLEPGDTATKEYVTLLDAENAGVGKLFGGQYWTKTYRLKVHEDAPVGTYRFKIVFQYVKDGVKEGGTQTAYIEMPVTKEGIIINVANIVTTPSEVRPGDNYIVLNTHLENSGRKDAKAIELQLKLPKGFNAPYANNNRVYTGSLTAGNEEALTLHFNVDENVTPGIYTFSGLLTYQDENDNRYEKEITFPMLVREKPVIVVTKSEGSLKAGAKGELRMTVKNVGTEKAEAVDVRLIKESSQPFAFDARSDFVGTLAPGEEATAVFTLEANSGAAMKKHSFTALVRAKGDSDKGDDNVYTFSREATILVNGKQPNYALWIGGALLLIALFIFLFGRQSKDKKMRKER